MERGYGSFHRVVPLSTDVDMEKSEARFSKGVLTVTLPKLKTPETERKKIEVKGETK